MDVCLALVLPIEVLVGHVRVAHTGVVVVVLVVRTEVLEPAGRLAVVVGHVIVTVIVLQRLVVVLLPFAAVAVCCVRVVHGTVDTQRPPTYSRFGAADSGNFPTMQIGRVDVNKLNGLFHKFMGLGKEALGVLLGNDRLQREGDHQQTKGAESLKALRKEAEAEAKEQKARAIGRAQGEGSGAGLLTEAKGKVKRAAGDVVGDPDLERDGRRDEERGAAGRQATQARASAKSHEAKARAAEEAESVSRN